MEGHTGRTQQVWARHSASFQKPLWKESQHLTANRQGVWGSLKGDKQKVLSEPQDKESAGRQVGAEG